MEALKENYNDTMQTEGTSAVKTGSSALHKTPQPKSEAMAQTPKYEIVKDQYYGPDAEGRPRLYRIRALKDIPAMNVKAGDFGGWVESEENLSQKNFCWIGECAMVYGGSNVLGFAYVGGKAEVKDLSTVMDHAVVEDNALVINGCIKESAKLFDHVEVRDSILTDFVELHGMATVSRSELTRNISAFDKAHVEDSNLDGHVVLTGFCHISNSIIKGDCDIRDNARVLYSTLKGDFCVRDKAQVISTDLRGKICIRDRARIHHCPEICARNVIIGHRADLYGNNYVTIGPMGPIDNMIFYLSDGGSMCSAGNELFKNPYNAIPYLHQEASVTIKEAKKVVFAIVGWLEP